jgi:hypothetical protein
MNIDLDPPSLNITAFSPGLYRNDQYYNWTDPRTGKQPFTRNSALTVGYYYAATNETFDVAKLRVDGSCQPTKSYQWGFSFVLLFICLILLGVWSIGTYILWLKAHLALRIHGEPQIAGEYKAVIELAAAMNNEFSKHDENLEFLRERQIKGKIMHMINGGTIRYDSPSPDKSFSFWDGFKHWAKRDKWWWPGYVLSSLFFVLGAFISNSLWIMSGFMLGGIFAARTVGQTGKSQCLIGLIFLILGIILAVLLAPAT